MSSLDLKLEDSPGYSATDKQIFYILRDFLQPGSALTLQSTAQSITAILPKDAPQSSDVWLFGEFCIEIVEQIPYHHPSQLKLVRLLEYLKLSPQMGQTIQDVATGQYVRHQILGESMRDNLSCKSRETLLGVFNPTPARCHEASLTRSPTHLAPDPENPGECVNFQAFAANIDEHRIFGSDPTWAIWALREAHEETCEETGQDGLVIRDALVLSAAQWILWYGQSLFKQILFSEYTSDHDLQVSKPGPLYPGKAGLSLDRWHFWRDGFDAVACGGDEEKNAYNQECMKVAARAASMMDSLEENMKF